MCNLLVLRCHTYQLVALWRERASIVLSRDQELAYERAFVSYGFTLLYVAMSFPAGVACDLYPRKLVLLASAAGWSAATASAAFAQSYMQLLLELSCRRPS